MACPFGLGLRKFALDPVVVISFKKRQKNFKCWIKCISKKFTMIGSANTCNFFGNEKKIDLKNVIFLTFFEKKYNDWIKSFYKSKWTGL